MNDIVISAFNEELKKIASESIKEAGGSYNLKIPKKAIGRLGWMGLGGAAGAAGMDAYQDYRVGNSIRRQQGM